MKLCLLILCAFFSAHAANAQKQNNHWYFGFNAGLDFTSGVPIAQTSDLSAFEGCASVSDPSGNLLFYTNGLSVWNRDHHLMPNGTGLAGGISSTQAAMILPLPGAADIYYLFTTEDQATDGGLFYSVIDMSLDEGLGDVVVTAKNIQVINGTAEKLTAVVHSNGFDVWVITHLLSSNQYLSFLLTSSGLMMTPVVSAIGSIYPSDGHIGPVRASHNGKKIISAAPIQRIVEMFDFDKSTGILSNVFNVNDWFDQKQSVYGFEFSPNDSLLYISTAIQQNSLNSVVQVNLLTEEMTVLFSDTVYNLGTLQLGPDHKIYKATYNAQYLDVIHQPDKAGIGCQFERNGFELLSGTTSGLGLPQYVPLLHYNLKLGGDTVICKDDAILLQVAFPEDCDSISVLWSDGSTSLSLLIQQPGAYWVEMRTSCGTFSDTIRVDQVVCDPLVYYDLNACSSYMSDGSHMDYSEFLPVYPVSLTCGYLMAGNVFRDSPQMNKHSCTPGVEFSKAMCISVEDICDYIPGHGAALLFEVSIDPDMGSMTAVTGISFFEKGPAVYDWIDGATGPNNYPQKFGIRILKNGTEIYREEDIDTKSEWTLEEFSFINHDSFVFADSAVLQIELFPYCPVGNGAEVSAWDIDEIRVYGGCLQEPEPVPVVNGMVVTKEGQAIPNVEMRLAANPSFTTFETAYTNVSGNYLFELSEVDRDHYIGAYRNDDVLNGVSTLDLLMIQKHLLGIQPFQSFHQYIAADINRSGHVSAVDLIELRKILLGIYTEFPNNTSWRFGVLPQEIYGTDISLFKETGPCYQQSTHICTLDFVGIKIGDLTGDARP